jgi:hypothetical protein
MSYCYWKIIGLAMLFALGTFRLDCWPRKISMHPRCFVSHIAAVILIPAIVSSGQADTAKRRLYLTPHRPRTPPGRSLCLRNNTILYIKPIFKNLFRLTAGVSRRKPERIRA